MKKYLFPLLALTLFGCQPAAEPAPATPKDAGPAPTPAATTPSDSTKTDGTSAKPDEKTSTEPRVKSQPGDIPSRIFQLRDLAKVTIKAPAHPIKLWVMNNSSKREEGMMFLTDKEVKDDEGMIFVFAKPDQQNFWMQNTLLPLDIIYFDAKGKALNICKGAPKDEKTQLPSQGPAQYVIELKQGQAEESGIKPGTILEIPKSLTSED